MRRKISKAMKPDSQDSFVSSHLGRTRKRRPSITDENIYAALVAFLTAILPAGTPVIQGLQNDVPEPVEDNFVLMIPLFRSRLGTDLVTYNVPGAGSEGSVNITMATEIKVQLDVHGPLSGDNAQLISTLWRSDYGVQQVSSQGYDIAPLYAEDPRQSPFINAEQQFEVRWTVDVSLQANPVVSMPQDFASELSVGINTGLPSGLLAIDVFYPPRPGSVGIIQCRAMINGRSF